MNYYQEIWEVPFFTTSEEEDNDTDSEEDEEQTKKREMSSLKLKEGSSMRQSLEKVRRYEEQLRQKANQTPEEEERAREKQRIADEEHQKELLAQQLKRLELEKQSVVKEEEEQLELKNLYLLNEDEFDWYNCTDEELFFVFASNKLIKKGEQVFNFYGRRTNRYLLCWYGFAYEGNEYNSLSFRLFMHKKSDEIDDSNVGDFIYADYISYDEWENGVTLAKKTIPANILSKEFRLKNGLLCDELLNYMRINKMKHYNGTDRDEIMLTQPRSINFELRVIEAALLILDKLLQLQCDYKHETISPQSNLHSKFAHILYEEHLNALKRQIALFRIAKEFLEGIARGSESFRSLYMRRYDQFESEEDFIVNREYLRKYLKAINEGIVKQNNSSS